MEMKDLELIEKELGKPFITLLDWKYISTQNNLSDEFINKFQDYLDWELISHQPNLSENLIRKFVDKVDWTNISIYQKFPYYQKNNRSLSLLQRHA